METIEVIQKLNEVKNVLMERGWAKSRLETADGRVCLLGARNIVMYGGTLVNFEETGFDEEDSYIDAYRKDEVSSALIKVMPEDYLDEMKQFHEIDSTSIVYMYNDRVAESFNDVVDLIDQAIVNQKDKL